MDAEQCTQLIVVLVGRIKVEGAPPAHMSDNAIKGVHLCQGGSSAC